MPHVDLLNSNYVAYKDFLIKCEGWESQDIIDYQYQELKLLLSEAYSTCLGYKALFDSYGVSPESFKNLDDIRKFPTIDKETLRDNLDKFSSQAITDRTYVTTGGSTGIPLGLYRDSKAFSKELAAKAHQYGRIGWTEEDHQIVFRGIPIDTPDHTERVEKFNELRFSSYYLTPDYMEIFLDRAWKYRPDWIRCYPSSGCIFAQWLKDTGNCFPTVDGVLCASENLYDFQKELLQEVFGGRVFSHYGHYELAALAGFCELEDTYHVLPQYGYVELLNPDGSETQIGEIGEIVATSFIMKATPIIRYKTQDYAVLKAHKCPSCGRPYQIWDRVEGRLQEFIITPSGRKISMTAINFHDDIFDQIKQFQFYQKKRGEVTFRYIPKDSFEWETLGGIGHRLKTKLGHSTSIAFEQVNEIPLTARGKHRALIQDIK